MVFVDLTRFKAENGFLLDSELDLAKQWCYIIKKARDISREESAVLSQKSKEMKMAVEHLKSLSRDQALRFQEEAREKFYRDFVASKAATAQKSRREGVEEGLQQGRAEGRAEGRQEGMQQVALSMLQKNLDISLISSVTKLSAEEIEKLKNGS